MLFALLGFASASLFVAGCGGGGGSSGGSPATAPPTTLAVTTRPLQNGDTFTYAGTTTKSFVYSGTSPEPQSTAVYAVAQSLKVSGPTTYDNASNVFEVSDAETDTSPLQQLGLTTNTYYALLPGSTTDLVTYGFTSTDTNGDQLAVTLPNVGNGNGLLDELPEARGQSWTNGPAETVNETSPGNETSARTVNADGSYTDTTNFGTGSIYPTASPGLPPATQAVITQNPDGSGSYVFYDNPGTGGPQQNYLEIDVATPEPAASGQPALVPIVSTLPSQAPTEVDVPLWYPQPLKLYAETDVDNGATTIPSSCNVPSSFGTTANAVVQTSTQYDTVVGTQETLAQTNYVVPTYGLACVSLTETLKFYYDYSGQSGIAAGPTVDVSATQTFPIEIETIATTLGLTASNAQAAAVHRASSASSFAGASASGGGAAGLRVTNARSNFLAFVEHEKLKRKSAFLQSLRATFLERLHR